VIRATHCPFIFKVRALCPEIYLCVVACVCVVGWIVVIVCVAAGGQVCVRGIRISPLVDPAAVPADETASCSFASDGTKASFDR
jgi:hypothetical protein